MNQRADDRPAREDKRRSRSYLGWLAGRVFLGVQIVWQAIWHLIDDGGMTLAGHIAFMTLFSLFPFLIFLTTLAGELGQTEAARNFVDMSLAAIPSEVSQAIRPAIEQVISTRRTGPDDGQHPRLAVGGLVGHRSAAGGPQSRLWRRGATLDLVPPPAEPAVHDRVFDSSSSSSC